MLTEPFIDVTGSGGGWKDLGTTACELETLGVAVTQ